MKNPTATDAECAKDNDENEENVNIATDTNIQCMLINY